LARATVWAALKRLREAGLIDWTKGSAARGQRATNRYALALKGKPKVQSSDFGSGGPKFNSRTRKSLKGNADISEVGEVATKRPEGAASCTVDLLRKEEAAIPPAAPRLESDAPDTAVTNEPPGSCHNAPARVPFHSNSTPATSAPISAKRYSEAQMDAALRGAWEHFERMNDPADPAAWE
jgi:hypothetical protein